MWMTDKHEMIRETAKRFFADEYVPHIDTWRRDGIVTRDIWRKAGEIGLLGISLPEQFGGSGGDLTHDAVILLEQARCGDVSMGLNTHNVACHYVDAYGTEQQKRRWLPSMIAGECVAAIAFSEPGGGSDLQAIRTSAISEGAHYRVNGTKTFISNGQLADIIMLVAKTDPSKRSKGISLLIVEPKNQSGFERGKRLKKLGLDGQDTMELFLPRRLSTGEQSAWGRGGPGVLSAHEAVALGAVGDGHRRSWRE